MATDNQKRLFRLISDFSVNTVSGWISNVYKTYGDRVAAGDALPQLIIKFAEHYFNYCALAIYSRDDEYINGKFDEMLSVTLARTYDPIDILQLIVMLSLGILQQMDIKDVVSRDYNMTMSTVQMHLYTIARRHDGLSADLHGCTPDHHHEPITGRVFTFAYDKYTMTDSGPVKLTQL